MSLAQDFGVWWQRYPRKIGKLAAEAQFKKAIASGVTLETLLAGVDAYKAGKPEYADWCHPVTWLRQGRWMDEYDRRHGDDRRQVQRETDDRRSEDWWEECKRLHHGRCNGQGGHRVQMQLDAGRGKLEAT